MFKNQDPYDLRLLSILRINATFPYVLPNVWLPSAPIIDVMDAGMRDNFGQESMLRMLNVFQDWIARNTGGVVFIQIRDRKPGEWDEGYDDPSITGMFTKPIMTLQHNWMKMQDYYQEEMVHGAVNGFQFPLKNLRFLYTLSKTKRSSFKLPPYTQRKAGHQTRPAIRCQHCFFQCHYAVEFKAGCINRNARGIMRYCKLQVGFFRISINM